MKLVADENVDGPIVSALRRAGHEVDSVAESDPSVSDDFVLEIANRDAALLLTSDTDFGELVFRQGRASGGVILIRLAGLSVEAKSAAVVSAIAEHGDEMGGRFSVISPASVRIRKL